MAAAPIEIYKRNFDEEGAAVFWKILDRVVDFLSASCLILMVSTVALQVFYRYILNRPLLWPLEVSLFLFVYMVWLGGTAGIRTEREIRIELAEKYLPFTIRKFLKPLLSIISIGVMVLVVYYGVKVMNFQRTGIYDALPYPRSILFAVAPIVGSLMGIYLVRRFIKQLRPFFASGRAQMKGD